MAKYKWLLVGLAVAFALSACAAPAAPAAEEAAPAAEEAAPAAEEVAPAAEEAAPAAEEGFTVCYDIYWSGNTWSVQLAKEFEMATRHIEPGVIKETHITDSESNIDKQLGNIEDLVTKGCDAIILNPLSQTALEGVLTRAREQGIKIVIMGTVEGDYYDASIGVDDYDFGVAGGKWLAEQLDCKGKIIMLSGLEGNDTSNKRVNGAMSEFDKCNGGIEVLANVAAKWDYAIAKTETANLLAAYPEIDGVYSQGGAMTMAAVEAFEAAGRKLVPMTAEDNNGFLKMWSSRLGDGFTSIALSKPTYMSAMALDTALKLLRGEAVEKDTQLEVPTITNDNVNDFVRPNLSDSFWTQSRMTEEEIKEVFPE